MPIPGATDVDTVARYYQRVTRRIMALELAISQSSSGGGGGDFVRKTGDTMSGGLSITVGAGEQALGVAADSSYIGFWNSAGNRAGYLQANGANGLYLNSEQGPLSLGSNGPVRFSSNVRIGIHPTHGSPSMWVGDAPGVDYMSLQIGGTLFMSGSAETKLRVGNVDYLTCGGGLVTTHTSRLDMQSNCIVAWPAHGGGWYMYDTWLRSYGDHGVWLGGGWFGSNGGITIGRSGAYDANYTIDTSGNMRCDGGSYMGGIMCYGGSTFNGKMTSGDIETRDGNRFISNGGYNGWYYNSSFFAQKYSGGDRADVGFHPTGVAYNWGATPNAPQMGLWTLDSGWYAGATASAWDLASTARYKQDMASWPPKSVGAATLTAVDRLRNIRVIAYRTAHEHALKQALPVRRQMALQRLNRWRDRKGVERYEQPDHDCDVHDCTGTSAAPCPRVLNWENPMLGITVEELVQVLPEAVNVGMDYQPESMRTGSMIGYLLAVCQEQQEHIDFLATYLGPKQLGPGSSNELEAA